MKSVFFRLQLSLLAFFSVCAVAPAQQKEPVYDEKPLSWWLDQIADTKSRYRGEAIRAMRAIGEPAIPGLIDTIYHKDREVVKVASVALGYMGKAAVPPLVELLGGKNRMASHYAAKALGRIGKDALPALIPALKRIDTQSSAVWALSWMGPKAVPDLCVCLKDKNWHVRSSAARALRYMGPSAKEAIPALIQAMKDEPFNHTDIAEVFTVFGPAAKDAVPVLIACLTEDVASERQAAARSLGTIGAAAKDARPTLRMLLDDPVDFVRRDAASALESIRRALGKY